VGEERGREEKTLREGLKTIRSNPWVPIMTLMVTENKYTVHSKSTRSPAWLFSTVHSTMEAQLLLLIVVVGFFVDGQ
jgi:hypothetical protein